MYMYSTRSECSRNRIPKALRTVGSRNSLAPPLEEKSYLLPGREGSPEIVASGKRYLPEAPIATVSVALAALRGVHRLDFTLSTLHFALDRTRSGGGGWWSQALAASQTNDFELVQSVTLRASSVGTNHLVSRIWTQGEPPLTNHQGSHGFSRPSGSSGNFFSSTNFMLSVYCHASRALHRSHHALRFGRVSSVSARPAGPNT